MLEFWSAAATSALARNAALAALLTSIACGVMGTYVVVRRISYIAAAIAHCVLAGLGAAVYLNRVHGWAFLQPIHGAVAAAVLAAIIIGWTTLRAGEREDTVIGAVWATGMAAGILFIHQTPGYHEELMSYLFGNILLVSTTDLWITLALDVLIVALVFVCYDRFQAVCFDEEFARLRNVHVDAYYLLLLILTALTVVLLSLVVGIVMVIALLTLPAAIASRWSGSLARTMAAACVLCALFSFAGLSISYAPDLPPGPVIIVIAGAAYFLTMTVHRLRQRSSRPVKS